MLYCLSICTVQYCKCYILYILLSTYIVYRLSTTVHATRVLNYWQVIVRKECAARGGYLKLEQATKAIRIHSELYGRLLYVLKIIDYRGSCSSGLIKKIVRTKTVK